MRHGCCKLDSISMNEPIKLSWVPTEVEGGFLATLGSEL